MTVSDLLTPWLMLAAVLVPLVYVEKWIHSHLYGVGWLLTNDTRSATILYYVLLMPGVLLHEAVQWLVAGAINVDTKTIRVWPEPQEDGTLRLDFVQVQKTNRFSLAIIGAAPLIVGLALVWVISNYILSLDDLLAAIGTGDLRAIGVAVRSLGSAPDFYLWLYLLFAISNAMLPTPADRQGWPLLVAVFVGVIVFLVVIGTGEQLLETYRSSVVTGLERLTTAFATVLVIEIPAILVIGLGEEILERTTNRKFQYKPPAEAKPRQPGSNEPLAPGEPRPSIYALELPIPLPPDRPKQRSASAPEHSAPDPTTVRERARPAPEREVSPDAPTQTGDLPPARQPAMHREETRDRPQPASQRPGLDRRPSASTALDSAKRLSDSTQAQPTARDMRDQPTRTIHATRPPDRRADRMPPPAGERPLGPSRLSGESVDHPTPRDRASFGSVPGKPRSAQPPPSRPGERAPRPSEPVDSVRPPASRPPYRDQRDTDQRVQRDESRLPQRRTSPFAADDDRGDIEKTSAPESDALDELEYIPFDDIEIPDDDDLL